LTVVAIALFSMREVTSLASVLIRSGPARRSFPTAASAPAYARSYARTIATTAARNSSERRGHASTIACQSASPCVSSCPILVQRAVQRASSLEPISFVDRLLTESRTRVRFPPPPPLHYSNRFHARPPAGQACCRPGGRGAAARRHSRRSASLQPAACVMQRHCAGRSRLRRGDDAPGTVQSILRDTNQLAIFVTKCNKTSSSLGAFVLP